MSEAFSLHRLREHRVDQADDRRVVFALEQVGLLGQVLREVREVGGLLDALGGLHGVVAGFVGLRAAASRTSASSTLLELQRHAEVAAHFGDRQRRGAGRYTHSAMPSCTRCTSTPWRLAKAKPTRCGRMTSGAAIVVHGLGGVAFPGSASAGGEARRRLAAPSRPGSRAWRAADSHPAAAPGSAAAAAPW